MTNINIRQMGVDMVLNTTDNLVNNPSIYNVEGDNPSIYNVEGDNR
jgi:hypothetical protein